MNSVRPSCRGLASAGGGGLVVQGGDVIELGGEDTELDIPYERRKGYIRFRAERGRFVCVPLSWCFPNGSLQVAFLNWWLPDVTFKVVPI
jgi:hypothetical protein